MAGLEVRESVTGAGRAERARVARAFTVGVLGPGHAYGDDAALLVSELFGNSARHSQSGTAKTQVALRDGFPSASAPASRVDGFQLTRRHGQGPGAPAALDPVRGRSAPFCTRSRCTNQPVA